MNTCIIYCQPYSCWIYASFITYTLLKLLILRNLASLLVHVKPSEQTVCSYMADLQAYTEHITPCQHPKEGMISLWTSASICIKYHAIQPPQSGSTWLKHRTTYLYQLPSNNSLMFTDNKKWQRICLFIVCSTTSCVLLCSSLQFILNKTDLHVFGHILNRTAFSQNKKFW